MVIVEKYAPSALGHQKMTDRKQYPAMGDVSDGYHTFDELYYHRCVLFARIIKDHKEIAWKSKLHHDGTMFSNYFIVGITTPEGDYSYHYELKYWDLFDCPEVPRAPVYDGHLPSDIMRLMSI